MSAKRECHRTTTYGSSTHCLPALAWPSRHRGLRAAQQRTEHAASWFALSRCCALSARGLGCADDTASASAIRHGVLWPVWCGGLVRRRGSVCCVLSSPYIHTVVDGARYTEAVERSPPWYGMPWCVDFSFSPKSRLRLKVELPRQCSAVESAVPL